MTLTLVRHPPVAESFRGVCYGSSDVPLAPVPFAELVEQLARHPVTHVVHSGLVRTASLAEVLAKRVGMEATADARLRECHFGDWELRRWEDIYAETGDAMMGMVHAPDTWRPPGGETVFEMRDRVLAWYRDRPTGHIVAIAHGGPIAALLGTLRGRPVAAWVELIPQPGEVVRVE